MTGTVEDRDLHTALDAFAELPEWLAVVMAPGRVAESLRRAVPELAERGLALTGAEVDRLRAKGGDWLGRCRVSLRRDGEPSEFVLVGRLLPPGAPAPDVPPTPFGEPGWTCYLADLRLHLEAEEADAALPALPSLVDP